MRAVWNDTVLAESDDTIVVEGNHYFPRDALNAEFFTETDTTTICPWKGTASYFTVTVDGEKNRDAAWTYLDPKAEARQIAGYVAFWKGIRVED